MKSKKSQNLITGTVMFLILNIVFFAILFIFVGNAGTSSSYIEKQYARKIALAIEELELGTKISIDISKLQAAAMKNNYSGQIVSIDYANSIVTVKLSSSGDGASFHYFNKLEPDALLIYNNREAIIQA